MPRLPSPGQHTAQSSIWHFNVVKYLKKKKKKAETIPVQRLLYSIMHSQWRNMHVQCTLRNCGILRVVPSSAPRRPLPVLMYKYESSHRPRCSPENWTNPWFHRFCSAPKYSATHNALHSWLYWNYKPSEGNGSNVWQMGESKEQTWQVATCPDELTFNASLTVIWGGLMKLRSETDPPVVLISSWVKLIAQHLTKCTNTQASWIFFLLILCQSPPSPSPSPSSLCTAHPPAAVCRINRGLTDPELIPRHSTAVQIVNIP